MRNKRSLGIVAAIFLMLVGTAVSDGAEERAISFPAIAVPRRSQSAPWWSLLPQ